MGTPCADGFTELALELRRGSGGAGTGEGFTVHYRSPTGTGRMEVPFHVRLCRAEVVDTSSA